TDAAGRCGRKPQPYALLRCPLLCDPAPPEQYEGHFRNFRACTQRGRQHQEAGYGRCCLMLTSAG
ncbi:hypothetical protein DV515_00011649, partial [Chloebia gouldiae]